MKQAHHSIRQSIFSVLDIFYPFAKWMMPRQTFYYAACGGGNTALSIVLYYISYNFILAQQPFVFGPLTISSHIMALFMASAITLPIGFYLSMYVVFQGSYLKRRIQFFRYFLIVATCLLMNYVFLKIFVEILHWYPTLAQLANTALVITFSYFSQRHFSFRSATLVPAAERKAA